MKKIILIASLCTIATATFAQDAPARIVRKGLFRSMATISTGAVFGPGVTNIYLQGNFNYYVDDIASIRNDGFYFINELGEEQVFNQNHQLFSGGSFHFKTKGSIDPYIAIQPGLAIASVWDRYECPPNTNCPQIYGLQQTKTAASPLISGVAGFNFYAQKFFHLFLEARYVQGKHLSKYGPTSLNELRFSFGLGWNINTIKNK